jgi:hypothetical protein
MLTFHYRHPSRANKYSPRILAPSRRLPLPPLKLKNALLPSSDYATRLRTTSHRIPGLRFWHPHFSPTSTPPRPPRPAPTLRRPTYIVLRAWSLSSCRMFPPSAQPRPHIRLHPLRMAHLLPLAEAATLSSRRVPWAASRPRNFPVQPHHHRPSRLAPAPPRRSGSG